MLRERIEQLAAENKQEFGREDFALFAEFKAALTRGAVRAAEKNADGQWRTNAWVKQGILLGFRMGQLADMSPADHSLVFFDKDTYPVRATQIEERVRIVPGGSSGRSGCAGRARGRERARARVGVVSVCACDCEVPR